MKAAIIGSRGITNVDMKKYIPPNTTEIISGGARGVDSIAKQYAQENNIKLVNIYLSISFMVVVRRLKEI